MKRVLFVLLTVFVCINLLTACSSDAPSEADTTLSDGKEQTFESGLGEITVTEKEDGTKIAKTEDGTEVEVSGESLMEAYEKYENLSESDGQNKEQLLSEMQIILDSFSETLE